ncbi:alkaline phosphatase family protein [Modestobacter sp. VKM Ac-2977]|uniref:alkaline phosphatase family protein n=1 Tax=Modestobacter sp. VKM Ac-2977 TaxID=3004131 RepID=UPI0022AAD2EC|nr:nucleotide pyrophosphatase/phosphodiesterase family protein [Modestobacter sp. VKM Ac-2977]MCZ2819939.1 alkaline phosphatase family protein [Modestobacter sp. VKM Ac-2977]
MSLPEGLQLPPYGSATLADVLPGVASALGLPLRRGGPTGAPLDLAPALAGARRVAVLLVDGLGAELVAAHPRQAPVLNALGSPVGTLSAPCPSTTPVSLVSLGTGLPPGSHGVLGFVTEVPGEGRTLNHVHWADDPDPSQWQAQPTVFEQATAAGVSCAVVAPHAFAGSGLTRAAYRGADYASAFSPGDLVAGMHAALRTGERSLVYGYTAELDLTGHVRGVDSPSWRAQLGIVDRLVEQLVEGLPEDAVLLVTADHGMVDVPGSTRLDIGAEPALSDGVRLLAGEPRARYVHAEPGAADDVLATWRAVLGDRAWVVSRAEAVASGVFGEVQEQLADRIGDVVALARGSWAFTDVQQEGPFGSMLAAYHGSLTPAELAIPLLAAHGRALG